MKISRWIQAALLLSPSLLGAVAGWVLQARSQVNPVYLFQFRIDLGNILILSGAILSTILIIIWAAPHYVTDRVQHTRNAVRLEAVQSRKRFLSRLDHELKNPLTALRAEMAFISDSASLEESRRVVEDMVSQVERLSRLITDLRKLAQLDEQTIERTQLSVEELLTEVVEASQDHPNYAERNVRLILLQKPWSLPLVLGDRGLLWLACYNLLDNALKFSQPGAEVEVRAFEASPWLVIEVTDNGPGIPDEDLPHIFEELYRGLNARGYPGSGLGLALVRAVVTLHEGTIAARSRPGQGTIFTLRLPCG